MLMKPAADRDWQPTDIAGVDRALFRHNGTGGRSSVVRLAAGTRVPRHRHEGHEEVLVLEGSVSIDGVLMRTGDYLYTEPGEEHDVVAVDGPAVIFVSSQKATPRVE